MIMSKRASKKLNRSFRVCSFSFVTRRRSSYSNSKSMEEKKDEVVFETLTKKELMMDPTRRVVRA